MIPKVIHYCWFGRNPLPELAKKCIASWRKYLPDYEIKEWNEDNFNVNIIPYTKEAYSAKKYAFVSDYARFWILYNYGGLYFDTDVEVIKPMNDIISKGAFMGCENNADKGKKWLAVAPGLGLGCDLGMDFYKKMLELYATLVFEYQEGQELKMKNVVTYTSEMLKEEGLRIVDEIQYCAGIWIYPKEYFCPINPQTLKCRKTSKTYTIHYYAGSWIQESTLRNLLTRILGVKLMRRLDSIRFRNK